MTKETKEGQLLFYGMQHSLAMYASTMLVPLIVGAALELSPAQIAVLVAADLFACGICTFLQIWKNKYTGLGMPVVMAGTFVSVSPMILIGLEFGISGVFGSILIANLIIVLIAGRISSIVQYIPPVVTGSVVLIVGSTLVPVAMNNLAGGLGSDNFGGIENILVGFFVFAFIVLGHRFLNGFLKSLSLLMGLVFGTLLANHLGMVDMTPVYSASWFSIITPLEFGMPTFHTSAILTMIVVAFVIIIEATGVYYAMAELGDKKLSKEDLKKAYRAEGLASVIGTFFNAFPHSTLAQNIGLAQISKIRNLDAMKYVIGIFIFLAMLPKFAALATIIPPAVLGGAMLIMFSMVAAAGIRMLTKSDLSQTKNLIILSSSIGAAFGVTALPQILKETPPMVKMFLESGIVMGAIVAIVVNFLFHNHDKEK